MRPFRPPASRGNFGYAKPAGDDIFEMRIDYGPGYRLYCALKGNELVLFLLRRDKSSQQRHREGEEAESGIRMLGTKMKIAMKWDASEYLEAEADIAAYLNAALEDGDTSVITAALGDIAQAKGMTQLPRKPVSHAMTFIKRFLLWGILRLILYKKSKSFWNET